MDIPKCSYDQSMYLRASSEDAMMISKNDLKLVLFEQLNNFKIPTVSLFDHDSQPPNQMSAEKDYVAYAFIILHTCNDCSWIRFNGMWKALKLAGEIG